jgi:hypothetical protein
MISDDFSVSDKRQKRQGFGGMARKERGRLYSWASFAKIGNHAKPVRSRGPFPRFGSTVRKE